MNEPIQKCFRGMKPKPPTIRTERVARRVAEEIVAEVNLDEFYWDDEEIPERIEDVMLEIMCAGRPSTVFSRLWKKQTPLNDRGERGGHPYGWEGIDEHCRHIASYIAERILNEEVSKHRNLYG